MLYGRVVRFEGSVPIALLEMPIFGLVSLAGIVDYKLGDAVIVWHFFPTSPWYRAWSYLHAPYEGEVEIPGRPAEIMASGRSPWPLIFPVGTVPTH